MKANLFSPILIALLTALALAGCSPPKWAVERWGEDQYMSYRIGPRNLALYTYPRKSYPYDREGIKAAVSDIHHAVARSEQGENLVVFIHGRGKYPEKAYGEVDAVGKNILKRIEAAYGAKVLLFHWPSWLTPWGYPSKNAAEAGAHLMPLFEALRQHREQGRRPRTTLLVHSMGAQVLERFLVDYDHRLAGGAPLFDSVVVNAPDVDLIGHRLWLDKIDFARKVYVVVNRGRDDLLKYSWYLLETPRLGRSLRRADGAVEPLSGRAFYVDLSPAGVDHDYYIGADRPDNLVLFYRNVIGGNGGDPLKGPGVSAADRPGVYVVLP